MKPFLSAFTRSRDTAPAFWSRGSLWIVLAAGPETAGRFAVMEQMCREGIGSDAHLHLEQDETISVLEGTIEIALGGKTFTASEGDFIAVPRWTPHSFTVISPTCRLLNSYFPAGFEQVIQASGIPATARTLPPKDLSPTDPEQERRLERRYGMALLGETAPAPLPRSPFFRHLPVNTGEAYWEVGILWTMLASSEETGGSYSYMEELLPTGPAAPPHRHEAADEIFYIIDGAATFFAGEPETALRAGSGSLVVIPRQTRHAFRIDSPTARLLNAYTPAGFEHTITPVATPATARTLPPADLPLTDMQRAAQIITTVHQKYPGAFTTVFSADFLNHEALP